MTDLPSIDAVFSALEDLRARRPLVHNITNYVAMSVSANVLLALGASPAMVHAAEEVEDFVAISDALAVNIGTLSPPWVAAMRAAVMRARALGKPWVLDPVGCGATAYRTQIAAELAALAPAVIRGNASEILSLSGQVGAAGKGVDSSARAEDATAAAALLAQQGFVANPGFLTFPDGGLYSAYSGGGHPDRVTADLGSRWELEQIALRAWPAAASIQGMITAPMFAATR